MSGSISLSAMQMRQIDRYFRASMLKILLQQYLPGADIRYKPFRNAQYDLGFNNAKIKANSYPTMPERKR